jgi:hypothetical protein
MGPARQPFHRKLTRRIRYHWFVSASWYCDRGTLDWKAIRGVNNDARDCTIGEKHFEPILLILRMTVASEHCH